MGYQRRVHGILNYGPCKRIEVVTRAFCIMSN